DEALIAVEPGDRDEIVALRIERGGVIRRFALLDADILAGGIIGPAVIEADMEFGVAFLEAAHRRALVAAGVEKRADLALGVARDDHRRAADMGGDEIVRLGELGFEGQEIPCPLENIFDLELEQLRIGIDVAMNAKHAVLGPIIDIALGGPRPHHPLLPCRRVFRPVLRKAKGAADSSQSTAREGGRIDLHQSCNVRQPQTVFIQDRKAISRPAQAGIAVDSARSEGWKHSSIKVPAGKRWKIVRCRRSKTPAMPSSGSR